MTDITEEITNYLKVVFWKRGINYENVAKEIIKRIKGKEAKIKNNT